MGAERSRYRTRRRSPGSAVSRPASVSSARCLAIACLVMGRRVARSVAVAGPPAARLARTARRLGSARAAKTRSATDSMSSGIEVFGQLAQLARPARLRSSLAQLACAARSPSSLAQLARPAVCVAVVGLAVDVVGQLRETALRKVHRRLQLVATEWLPSYGNRSVASSSYRQGRVVAGKPTRRVLQVLSAGHPRSPSREILA